MYMYHFLTNIFYKNKQTKLCFRDRIVVLNLFYFLYGRGTPSRDRSTPSCSRVLPMLLAYVEQVADGVFPSRIVLKVESRSFKKKLKVGSTPSISNYNSF